MQRYEEWADTIIEKIRGKMEWVSEKNKNKIPYRTDGNGDYDDRSDHAKEWRIDDGLALCGSCTRIRANRGMLRSHASRSRRWNNVSGISTACTMT